MPSVQPSPHTPPINTSPSSVSTAQSSSPQRTLSADRYVAYMAPGQFRECVEIPGHDTLDITRGTDGRCPSFIASAGQTLKVSVASELSNPSADPRLIWTYHDGEQREQSVPLRFETDMRSGAVLPATVNLDVPENARGMIRLRLQTTEDGRTRTRWDPTYDVRVMPKTGAAIHFDDAWKAETLGEIRAGDFIDLAYDLSRLQTILGQDAEQAFAYVQFDDHAPEAYPISLTKNGETDPEASFTPRIHIPYEASSVKVWFQGEADGQVAHDSAFGQNYQFRVGIARGDSDPAWKKTIMSSSQRIGGLREDNFQALGPNNPRYNCIAWSIDNRQEWVWPGDKVSDFDRMYAEHGYHALDGINDYTLGHDPGMEKVALYGSISNIPSRAKQGPLVTHAARQLEDGQWTSKLGSNGLIAHADARTVEGGGYGRLIKVYARPRG